MSSNDYSHESLIVQSLMERLQLSPPRLSAEANPDHLLSSVLNLSLPISSASNSVGNLEIEFISNEEYKVEREIVRTILTGDTDSLRPNSGQTITIFNHNICVRFYQELGSDYRVWEWHGHIMAYDEINGYSLEYIHGNYFEWLSARGGGGKERKADEESPSGDMGLRGLIGDGESGNGRILRRNVNMGSQG